jgi:hypothetical protein
MKQVRTSLFCISLLLVFCQKGFSQEEIPADSVAVAKEKYGLRLGVNLSKPVRSLLDEDYRGFEILGDYRVYKDYYLAAEIGNEKFVFQEPNINAEISGSYFKIGANYNAYDNWAGMQNSIFVGLRYAFSTFSETLTEYRIYTGSDYFEPDVRFADEKYAGLTSSWLEFQAGLKAEVLNNLYLGVHVELKYQIGEKGPRNFDVLYIPGFNKTYDGSNFGVGWGYSVSYMIPFYRK